MLPSSGRVTASAMPNWLASPSGQIPRCWRGWLHTKPPDHWTAAAAGVVPRGVAPARAAENFPGAGTQLLFRVDSYSGHGMQVLLFLIFRQFIDPSDKGGQLDGSGIMHPSEFRQQVEILAVRSFQGRRVLGAAGEAATSMAYHWSWNWCWRTSPRLESAIGIVWLLTKGDAQNCPNEELA